MGRIVTVHAAWSNDEADVLLFEDLDTGSVKVQHHHLDEFDADEDFNITVGEFSVADLQRALTPPTPATQHVMNKRPSPFARLFRGKKGWQK